MRLVPALSDLPTQKAKDLPWSGPIVITATEDLAPGEWCGAVWPLDEEQRWLIQEAFRAANADSGSMLYAEAELPDDDE